LLKLELFSVEEIEAIFHFHCSSASETSHNQASQQKGSLEREQCGARVGTFIQKDVAKETQGL